MVGSPRETPLAPTIPFPDKASLARSGPESWPLTPLPTSCETDRRRAFNVTGNSLNTDGPDIWLPGAGTISRSKGGLIDPFGEGVTQISK
jgi:hypothetical protein